MEIILFGIIITAIITTGTIGILTITSEESDIQFVNTETIAHIDFVRTTSEFGKIK